MTAHRITYEGPSSLAVRTATLLADAEGIELTSAVDAHPGDLGDPALLVVTVDGTTDAVAAAVRRVQEDLPAGASITVEEDDPDRP
jgi:hypothetical protein